MTVHEWRDVLGRIAALAAEQWFECPSIGVYAPSLYKLPHTEREFARLYIGEDAPSEDWEHITVLSGGASLNRFQMKVRLLALIESLPFLPYELENLDHADYVTAHGLGEVR
jgi:hypothetical protein